MNLSANETVLILSALVFILVGIGLCFAGWRFFKLALILAGGIIGFLIGSALASEGTDNSALILVAGVVGILVGVILAYPLFDLATIFYGISGGVALAAALAQALNAGQTLSIILLALGIILGIVLAFLLRKYIIMLGTAFNGAAAMALGVAMLIPGNRVLVSQSAAVRVLLQPTWQTVVAVAAIVLGLIGFVTQWNDYVRNGNSSLD
ncbi:MAG: DUF4203 domain-containing protein [Anaerolineae bacterium]|nr:DUF4203 domain-containing protein [Anaerolineae bacterium]